MGFKKAVNRDFQNFVLETTLKMYINIFENFHLIYNLIFTSKIISLCKSKYILFWELTEHSFCQGFIKQSFWKIYNGVDF